MLTLAEPRFARTFREDILLRLQWLGLDRAEVIVLSVNDAQELKGGGLLQVLFDLRAQGVVGEIGLAHANDRTAEWLALHSAARVLVTDYSLGNQSARYRTLQTARDYGMAVVALHPPARNQPSLRFALGQAATVLPVLDHPLPEGITPMSVAETQSCWDEYQRTHAEPDPLPRSTPPDA
jgi:hypothetical protein